MSRKKTKAEDIRDPERYFSKWLYYENKHQRIKEYERSKRETSLDELESAGEKVSLSYAVNKDGELFMVAEAHEPVFSWLEEIQNEELYQVITELS